jgi:hypothetical protein
MHGFARFLLLLSIRLLRILGRRLDESFRKSSALLRVSHQSMCDDGRYVLLGGQKDTRKLHVSIIRDNSLPLQRDTSGLQF